MSDTNKKKSNYRNFNRFANRFNPANRNTGPRERPISMQIPQSSNQNGNAESTTSQHIGEPLSFRIGNANSEYPGWKLYFPQEEYKSHSEIVRKIRAFEDHIRKYPLLYKLQQIRQALWFPLPLQRVLNDTNFMSQWHNFLEDLNESTEETLLCAGLAVHQRILKDLAPLTQSELSAQIISSKLSLVTIRARIQGHLPVISLRSLKQDNYGRLISVRGTVIRVNAPEVICTWLAYRCAHCSCEQAIRQNDRTKAMAPISCKGSGCKARSNFQALNSSQFTRTEPYQTIRLQESMQNNQNDTVGQIPKSIEVELAYDLVDSVCPGDDVTLTGIIKVKTQDDGHRSGSSGAQASMHRFYIHGVNVVSNKNTMTVKNSDFTEHEMELFQQIKNEPNPFNLLIHSLCPPIFGHEMVKAGLILALLGGSGNGACENNSPGVGKRSEIHVLIVGDPGIGKSHLLQACANVSPRGYFVCGNSTSNAGLTVSIRNEKGSGDSMEAGALVLADQGVCCIDEFDKMTANYQSLLQVMEQQSVSVAKAGVLCALPARTCILAAANPSGGHYNKAKTVSENLKVWPTLLSRFDLVFILLDRADKHLDDLLTAHIGALHSKNRLSASKLTQTQLTQFGLKQNDSVNNAASSAPLIERLRLGNSHNFTPIPHNILQKYIGYAKKFCFPILTREAAAELKKFYLELRKTRQGIDSIPVTTRQLEALIRLTQARARVELAAQATRQHALDVLAIFRYTMVDVLSTDQDTLQMRRNINGSGMSQATQAKKYLQLLQRQNKTIFSFDELMDVASQGGFEQNLRNIIDSLNVQGFLIKRGRDIYKFMN